MGAPRGPLKPLRPEDPREVGGHRLLARLGAGGMGVVYLARSGGGALVALKVIRADRVSDPGLRARFGREAAVAAGLTGPWLVPVTSADAEAAEPWLATSFVAAPSLGEAVAACGPLPESSVRVLGARLADALAEVHAAGLVHRDVKPANVLLALDGPRLIDFGIARPTGASALTAPGAIVGTPGYVPPEQAGGKGAEPLPAGDVFALGCVLVFAASGRRPFGDGDPYGVFYRTVFEGPDVAGVPEGLRMLVMRCLAKEPRDRPTAAAVAYALGPVDGAGDWLPSPVLRLVAERSSVALDPPPPEEPAPPVPAPEGHRPGRRGVLFAAGAAVAGVTAGGIAYLVSRRRQTGRAGAASPPPVHTLAVQADLTGPGRTDGVAVERGVRLAVAAHNARAGAAYRLALRVVDDGGAAERARTVAQSLTADGTVTAVIGPTTAAAAAAVAELYERARTAMLLVNVSDGTTLHTSQHRTMAVTRAGENNLQAALISHLTREAKATRTAVIEDRAAGAAGWAWVSGLRATPPNEGTVTVHSVDAGTADFAPAVREALAAEPQAVVHTGTSPGRAAACARELARLDFTGARAGMWHVMTPTFLSRAGRAAEGWVFSSPFTAADAPGLSDFAKAHHDRYDTPPARWSVEAYDAVGLLTAALDTLPAPDATAATLAQRLFSTTHQGLAKPLAFAPGATHALQLSDTSLFLYEARDRAFHFLGPYGSAPARSD
ncbi:bifunctional serine/threonine-protein kinase/ABC transporter substrate-binding protein [Streptomyces sp. WMMC940]|uniref:bifunctional serine/threonine-protein kinase/ABC transporter substrate-binding protein n=1 Tax=Streptomyces sp. WMMC940 TaxID=3015153 RepID=UPI0022B6DF8C|nr:bifunctional serine/threonine-protein kinase/ABC transporter substrate-binding protein [Streptomyces sp. WMMC940]MCZ7462266.1 bifunctional serine/threonine-protein kinase/ABC transporter substrate-binding protein [Streptomyces sp. WMMC940]